MKKLILSLSLLASFAAQAAGSSTGVPITPIVRATDGFVFIKTSGTTSGQPSCASGYPGWFVINGSTAAGAVAVAQIRGAYYLGKTVTLSGTGGCTLVNPGFEDLLQINHAD